MMGMVIAVTTVPETRTRTKQMKTRTSLAIFASRGRTRTGTDLLVKVHFNIRVAWPDCLSLQAVETTVLTFQTTTSRTLIMTVRPRLK